jgi:hypothetical protein
MRDLSVFLAVLLVSAVNASPILSLLRAAQPQSKVTTPKKNIKQLSRLRLAPFEVDDGWVAPVQNAADYVFVPPEVGTDIYVATIIAIIPFIWATKEFGSRITTQRQCLVCTGSGLVYVTRQGSQLSRPRKCWSCGGFLPWLGWKMFFFSTFFDIGNGGPLQRPSADYEETNEKIRRGEVDYSRKVPDGSDAEGPETP